MPTDNMFESATRTVGDRAGVFEFDGETAYFYLYDTERKEGQKVLAAIHILSGNPDFIQEDVVIRWNTTESAVGLFIRGQLWAAFDAMSHAQYGGNYMQYGQPQIAPEISDTLIFE